MECYNVAVPVQIYELTGSSLQVGAAVALDGAGMFLGLMLGGILADRMDRKWLILFSRTICGVGFILLTMNAYLSESSILAIYVISLWDGFFSAIGMSALMASIPFLVGRENIAAAGALSMLIVRIGSVVSSAVAGILIVSFGVKVNYILAAVGTLCTLVTLVTLPNMKPQERALKETPIESLLNGFKFVLKHKVIRAVVTLGALEALQSRLGFYFLRWQPLLMAVEL